MEALLFKQMEFVRKRTLAALDATEESMADQLLDGVNNTLRWNYGHIFVSHDTLLYPLIGKQHHASEDLVKHFSMGTSPKDWIGNGPSLKELRQYLEEQPERMKQDFAGKLEEPLQKPFKLGEYELVSVGEVLSFAIWHEGLHQGTVNTIKRALGVEDLWSPVKEKQDQHI
ncbi:DinB superfamily protein [Bacillus sp. THAF10]|uniref:DinB family protein n=1 Tax=Bacillus sp. THAF10 TaxID=2587848 RepID=UPI001267F449|nr:DinB family protein [Bacillus sp. THAF10]QFT88114.1 DinB superfamily protein [Bacillus sp. THAF10]